MDRRTKKLVMMAITLVVLIGVYIATLDIRPDAVVFVEETELPLLFERDGDVRVVALHIDNEYDIRLERDNESSEWRFADHSVIRLDQISVLTLAFSMLNLPSHGYIAPADIVSLDVFGLGESTVGVTADYTDGTRERLYVGNMTPDGRFYYARVDGSDYVHLIDVRAGRRMFQGHNDFLDSSLPRPILTSLVKIEFLIGGDRFEFIPGPPTAVENFGWMRDEFISHGVGAGKRLDMSFGFHSVFQPLEGLRLAGVVLDADIEQDDERFGLMQPQLMMRLVDSEGVALHFYAGNETEGRLRYFMLEGDPFVYTVATGLLDRLETVDRTRLFQRRITDVIIAQANTVRIRSMDRDVTIHPNSNDEHQRAYRRIFDTTWDSYIDPVDLSSTPAAWTLDIDGHILEENIFPRQLEYITEGNFIVQPDGSIRYSLTYTFHVLDDLFYAISRDGAPAVTAISRNTLDRVLGSIE